MSFQRAESAQREAESLRERLSSSNQSQPLGSPTKADPDTVSNFSLIHLTTDRGIDRLNSCLTFYSGGSQAIHVSVYEGETLDLMN